MGAREDFSTATTDPDEAALAAVPPARPEVLPSLDMSAYYRGPDDPAIIRDARKLKKGVQRFERLYVGTLKTKGVRSWANALETYDDLLGLYRKLENYVDYLACKDPEKYALDIKVINKIIDVTRPLDFFIPEICSISIKNHEQALRTSPRYARYKRWLEDERAVKKYNLDGDTEELIYRKNQTGTNSLESLYDKITDGIEYVFRGRRISEDHLIELLKSADPEIRRESYYVRAAALAGQAKSITHIFNDVVKGRNGDDIAHGYKSTEERVYAENKISQKTVRALVGEVQREGSGLMHRLMRMKCLAAGKDVLKPYDIKIPMGVDPWGGRPIAFNHARSIIVAAYKRFSPELAQKVDEIFASGWIDAEVDFKKTQWTYCNEAAKGLHPFIMIQWDGSHQGLMDLAHEVGHALHFHLNMEAVNRQSLVEGRCTLQETASIFSEILVNSFIIDCATDNDHKQFLLEKYAFDALSTVVYQERVLAFERMANRDIVKNGDQTPEILNDQWTSMLSDMYGPYVDYEDVSSGCWMSIQHIFSKPFYVFSYSMSGCLAHGLYAQYKAVEDKRGFAQNYIDFLRHGSLKTTEEAFAPFGIKMRGKSFWRKALGEIEGIIDDLEDSVKKSLPAPWGWPKAREPATPDKARVPS